MSELQVGSQDDSREQSRMREQSVETCGIRNDIIKSIAVRPARSLAVRQVGSFELEGRSRPSTGISSHHVYLEV